MKRIIFSALSIALVAGGISSCGKSTKGKMSNDWKVTSYEESTTNVNQDGDRTVSTTSANESTVTITNVSTPSGGSSTTTTQNGTINAHTLKIEKDGTYRWTRDLSTTEPVGAGNTLTTKLIMEETGTWSFIGKNKEEGFKKNERVIFNTLTRTSTTSATLNQGTPVSSSTTKDTYMAGENVMIFTVTESKGKELQLSYDADNSSTEDSEVSTSKTTTRITLKEK